MRNMLSALLVLLFMASCALAGDETAAVVRDQANKLYQQGNYAESLVKYQSLCERTEDGGGTAGYDLEWVVRCFQNLNRLNEFDDYVEKIIKLHENDWQFLWRAANIYNNANHEGFIVAGKFERGHHRGGGKYANSWERDRVRSLQLMDQAVKVAEKVTDRNQTFMHNLAQFYLEFANHIMNYRGYSQAWRLQYLSDLSQLPDYDEGYYYYHGNRNQGCPVDADGNPIYYRTPKSWDVAANDGERWRWLMMNSMELDKRLSDQLNMSLAAFYQQQLGVQTMAYYGANLFGSGGDEEQDESGVYAVHTLKESETITRTAIGIRRFTLPEEFNFLKIYENLAANAESNSTKADAAAVLGNIYENRRQYDEAVKWYKVVTSIVTPPHWGHQNALDRIAQITGNWGSFESTMTHPAGQGAKLNYKFRNGSKVRFEAYKIDIPGLLDDVKAYLKKGPNEVDWQKLQFNNIGYRIVTGNEKKYLREKVAGWDLDLTPRKGHWDRRVTVATPLQRAGAYLVYANLDNGNISRIVVWISDTVIIKKPVKDTHWYYIADAVTGKPIEKANVEFFGYRQEWVRGSKRYDMHTDNFSEFTDKDGQLFIADKRMRDEKNNYYNWLAIARKDDRLAFLGFNGVWLPSYYDHQYNQTKTLIITDRPVYRPNNKVNFKAWIRKAQYDQEDKSLFAGKSFTVMINNPKGEKIFEKSFVADEYGGINGELTLPEDATLGVYGIRTIGISGYNSFRVEEYKKPEFEVTVDAPKEPVMLGEKIEATIAAKYYFGSPVTKAKLKYKILRNSHDSRWYPVMPWDWFYGSGYWWYAYDYSWYPGWGEWGCRMPIWWWWSRGHEAPEIVAEGEAKIGADGTYKVMIDTTLAKEIHGDQDHKYEITAEVTDESRRTIVGTGSVLVARKPFKV
ncbi:MAG: alpha-2-macroglobulin, partial [Planctomycetes bacterium]|nr:alpha-2-macroglobulin [Planctomycetota bacterium]